MLWCQKAPKIQLGVFHDPPLYINYFFCVGGGGGGGGKKCHRGGQNCHNVNKNIVVLHIPPKVIGSCLITQICTICKMYFGVWGGDCPLSWSQKGQIEQKIVMAPNHPKHILWCAMTNICIFWAVKMLILGGKNANSWTRIVVLQKTPHKSLGALPLR